MCITYACKYTAHMQTCTHLQNMPAFLQCASYGFFSFDLLLTAIVTLAAEKKNKSQRILKSYPEVCS